MKTIRVSYNLQELTQTPEAHLSDLFVLLYTMFLVEQQKVKSSRYSLNKLFPYIFTKLEEGGNIDSLRVFNLPFYKMKGGHYNKSLRDRYLKKLTGAGLIEETERYCYVLTSKARKLMREFYNSERKETESNLFESLVDEFVKKYLQGRDDDEVYKGLWAFSHTTLVDDDGRTITVDNLQIDDNKAIAYNGRDFKEGRRSSIVPPEYLTALAYELRNRVKISGKDRIAADSLLSSV